MQKAEKDTQRLKRGKAGRKSVDLLFRPVL